MNLPKEFFAHTVRILLGLIFIASGLLKLFPIEPFELNFIDLGIANWFTAPIIARALIGFELLLGSFLIFDLAMKKFTIKATYSILIFFTLYLFYQIYKTGNNGNCGCFGTYLQMTPLESIFKNIGMIAMLTVVQFIPASYDFLKTETVTVVETSEQPELTETIITVDEPKEAKQVRSFRKMISNILVALFIVTAFVSPYIINPPDALSKGHRIGAVNYPLGLKEIYSDTSIIAPTIDLTKGKHIVAFMSLSCWHCRMSALKMHVIQLRNPDFPFYLLLYGDTTIFKRGFFEFSKAENIPHSWFNNDNFFNYVDGSVPAIFWLDNDIVKFRSLYSDMNEDDIKNWLQNDVVPVAGDTTLKKNISVDSLK